MPVTAFADPDEGRSPWSRLAFCDRCLHEVDVDTLEPVTFTDTTERWCPDCSGQPRRRRPW